MCSLVFELPSFTEDGGAIVSRENDICKDKFCRVPTDLYRG